MHEAPVTDRPDLPGTEHAGQRSALKVFGDHASIVIGGLEQMRASTVAREEQSGIAQRPVVGEQLVQVGIGRRGVSDLELDRRADRDPVANNEGAGVAVDTEDASDEEITSPEVGLVLVDHPAEVETAGCEYSLVLRKTFYEVL